MPAPDHFRLLSRQSVADREIDLACHLFGLVDRIDTCREDLDAKRVEFYSQTIEADQLPAAIRSPMTAVEQDNPVTAIKPARQSGESA